jgi:hypothetical protein
MSNEVKADGVGGEGNVSDASQVEPNQGSEEKTSSDESTKKVSWKNHRRALDDMHRFKGRANELETRINELEEEKLREKENWKSLAERYKQDADKWKSEAENGKNLFANTQKFNAVKKVALEAGLLPEALDDLDLLNLEEVVVESTDQGRYAVHGVKEFVERLKTTKSHWFSKKQAPNVNSGGGTVRPDESTPLTPADVYQAEREMKQGKITREQYQGIYQRYCTQDKQLGG